MAIDSVLGVWEVRNVQNPKISLVIITKNEAKNIERCIRSVPWADEVVVLDSDSTDQTCELAAKAGARVVVEPWRGFRAQKNRAVELAKNDWILSLDGDEALSPELADEILTILRSEQMTMFDGFECPRRSYNLGRWIRFGGWYPDWQLRVFDRRLASWQAGHVHERVSAKRILRLKNPILHWPFDKHEEQVNTNNRYSTLGAQDLADRGVRFSIFKLVTKPVSKFIETYLVKLGFLDGLAGFVISVGAAYSVFMKWAKLWELQNLKEASSTMIRK